VQLLLTRGWVEKPPASGVNWTRVFGVSVDDFQRHALLKAIL